MAWPNTVSDCDRRLKDENARLRAEADERRYEDERRQEQQERDRQERRREMQAEREERLRTPADWEEAFANGLILFRREALSEQRDNAEIARLLIEHPGQSDASAMQPTTFFIDMPGKIEQAREIYHAVMADVEKQIAELRRNALSIVADRVETETDNRELAQALREDTPDYLTNW